MPGARESEFAESSVQEPVFQVAGVGVTRPFEDESAGVSQGKTGRIVPIGRAQLSIEGDRVAWAENINDNGLIRQIMIR
jgi:hypothetical protein